MENNLYKRHPKYMKIWGYIILITLILSAIAILCLPIASYNATRLESTKMEFGFMELVEGNKDAIIGLVLMVLGCAPSSLIGYFVEKNKVDKNFVWIVLSAFVGVILFIIGEALFSSATDSFYNGLNVYSPLKKEIGFFLFISLFIALLLKVFYEVIAFSLIKNSNYTEEQLFGKESDN